GLAGVASGPSGRLDLEVVARPALQPEELAGASRADALLRGLVALHLRHVGLNLRGPRLRRRPIPVRAPADEVLAPLRLPHREPRSASPSVPGRSSVCASRPASRTSTCLRGSAPARPRRGP